jgi:hypothetical protein
MGSRAQEKCPQSDAVVPRARCLTKSERFDGPTVFIWILHIAQLRHGAVAFPGFSARHLTCRAASLFHVGWPVLQAEKKMRFTIPQRRSGTLPMAIEGCAKPPGPFFHLIARIHATG